MIQKHFQQQMLLREYRELNSKLCLVRIPDSQQSLLPGQWTNLSVGGLCLTLPISRKFSRALQQAQTIEVIRLRERDIFEICWVQSGDHDLLRIGLKKQNSLL
jgi:hypothetical protein